jgi:hypothetical protein
MEETSDNRWVLTVTSLQRENPGSGEALPNKTENLLQGSVVDCTMIRKNVFISIVIIQPHKISCRCPIGILSHDWVGRARPKGPISPDRHPNLNVTDIRN